MEIVETAIYTELITSLLSDEEYFEFQKFLADNPTFGTVIPGSKGLRKVRWKLKDKGKSGGLRNIYYYYEEQSSLYMIFVYEKSKAEDLTPKQIEALRKAFLGD